MKHIKYAIITILAAALTSACSKEKSEKAQEIDTQPQIVVMSPDEIKKEEHVPDLSFLGDIENEPDPESDTRPIPTIFGANPGMTVTEFLKNKEIQKADIFQEKTSEKILADIQEYLRNQTSEENKFNFLQGTALLQLESKFTKNPPELAGLPIHNFKMEASYDPIQNDFLVLNFEVWAKTPQNVHFQRTLIETVNVITSEYGTFQYQTAIQYNWSPRGINQIELTIRGENNGINLKLESTVLRSTNFQNRWEEL